jgi:hypothetical protein
MLNKAIKHLVPPQWMTIINKVTKTTHSFIFVVFIIMNNWDLSALARSIDQGRTENKAHFVRSGH